MKIFGLILLYLKIFDKVFGICTNKSPLACAFVDIYKSLEEKNRQIAVQSFSEKRKIIKSVLAENSENPQLTFRHQKFEKNKKEYKINESGILIFDTLRALSEFNYKTSFANEGPKDWQFYVFVDKSKASEIKSAISETKILKGIDYYSHEDRSEIVHFQFFVTEEKGFFILYTFDWFTRVKCNKHQLVEVNRFNKKTKTWKNRKFQIDKFDNFFGCPLIFSFNNWYPEIAYRNKKTYGFQYDLKSSKFHS
jgi:hypothetical protein